MNSNGKLARLRTFLRAMESVMTTGDDGLDLAALGGSATFFVPTEAAFEAVGTETVENAIKSPALLKTVSCSALRDNSLTKPTKRWRPILVF